MNVMVENGYIYIYIYIYIIYIYIYLFRKAVQKELKDKRYVVTVDLKPYRSQFKEMLSAGKEILSCARKDAVDKAHKRKCGQPLGKTCEGTVGNITVWLAVQFG